MLANLTRRDFLKATSATTAVCLLPLPTIPEPLVVVWRTATFDFGWQYAVSITLPPSMAARIGWSQLAVRKTLPKYVNDVHQVSKVDELELKEHLLKIVQEKLGQA